MARIEENPLSDWAILLQEIVRAALDCRGRSSAPLGWMAWSAEILLAFTSEQMDKLSEILEATVPQATSSPPQSPRSRGSTSSSRQSMRSGRGIPSPSSLAPEAVGHLAKEFGVDPFVVEALAQRLAAIH